MPSFSLKVKILLLSGFMTVSAACIGIVGYVFAKDTIKAFEKVVGEDVPALRALNRMLLSFRLARIELLHLTMPGAPEDVTQHSIKAIEENWASFNSEEKWFLEHAKGSKESKELFEAFSKASDVARADFDKALELYNKNPAEDSPERRAMIQVVTHELPKHGEALRDATKSLVEYQAKRIDDDSLEAHRVAESGIAWSFWVTIIGAIFGQSFAFLFSRKLSAQMSSIIDVIDRSSSQVAAASSEVAASSQELSQAATEQAASLEETAASLEETAASLEEITSMISKASESAQTTETNSAESQNKAIEGRAAVDQMLTSMDEISQSNEAILNQINQSNKEMTEIVKVIQEIGNKTKVINEIVFQTKLLSFNASVEAARAGEHGKGFAVVAEEVGNLAQMSGSAAKEITDLLDSSIAKVEKIVQETKVKVEALVAKGKQKVDSGVSVAQQCSTILDEIVQNITKVSALAQEISTASKEQSQGVGEISKAMAQLDIVTQQNSSMSSESANASEQLSSQAEALKVAVDQMIIAVRGGAGSSSPNLGAASFSKPSNVVSFKKESKVKEPAKSDFKVASGDGVTPNYDDKGFQEN